LKTRLEVEWRSPKRLDVTIPAPKIPDALKKAGNDALYTYFEEAKTLKNSKLPAEYQTLPSLGILWKPFDETVYCSGLTTTPKREASQKTQIGLVLEINAGEKVFRHLICTYTPGKGIDREIVDDAIVID